MTDIRFRADGYDFSYRIAGIVVVDGKVLLQKPVNSNEFAMLGGGAKLGEASSETLIREFAEELGADIKVGKLRWVEEVFWTWNGRPNHQISLYFEVKLIDSANIPLTCSFHSKEPGLEFFWIPIKDLRNYVVYPERMVELLPLGSNSLEHWIRCEDK